MLAVIAALAALADGLPAVEVARLGEAASLTSGSKLSIESESYSGSKQFWS